MFWKAVAQKKNQNDIRTGKYQLHSLASVKLQTKKSAVSLKKSSIYCFSFQFSAISQNISSRESGKHECHDWNFGRTTRNHKKIASINTWGVSRTLSNIGDWTIWRKLLKPLTIFAKIFIINHHTKIKMLQVHFIVKIFLIENKCKWVSYIFLHSFYMSKIFFMIKWTF